MGLRDRLIIDHTAITEVVTGIIYDGYCTDPINFANFDAYPKVKKLYKSRHYKLIPPLVELITKYVKPLAEWTDTSGSPYPESKVTEPQRELIRRIVPSAAIAPDIDLLTVSEISRLREIIEEGITFHFFNHSVYEGDEIYAVNYHDERGKLQHFYLTMSKDCVELAE